MFYCGVCILLLFYYGRERKVLPNCFSIWWSLATPRFGLLLCAFSCLVRFKMVKVNFFQQKLPVLLSTNHFQFVPRSKDYITHSREVFLRRSPGFFIATIKKTGTGLFGLVPAIHPWSAISMVPCSPSGMCSAISDREQSSNLQRSSSVFVETDIFLRRRCTVLPLIWNLTLNV